MVWDPMYPHPPVTRMHGGVDDSSLLIFGFGLEKSIPDVSSVCFIDVSVPV